MENILKYVCEECGCNFYIEDEDVIPYYCVFCGSNYIGQPDEEEVE